MNKKKTITNVYTRLMTSIGIVIIGFICYYSPPIAIATLFVAICAIILFYEWPQIAKHNFIWPLTPLYPIAPFAMLVHLCFAPQGKIMLFILFLVVWSFDTGSYIFGNMFGKTPINRHISLNKTWEGVLGGLVSAITLYILFYFIYFTDPISITNIFIILLLCISALVGDLFESKLKRNAQIKDSGAFLPGHGGFLDRFDGILFAVIILYILYILQIFFI